MRRELCIEVDDSDRTIGYLTKYEAHRVKSGEDGEIIPPTLHRAFSVFILTSLHTPHPKILIQQRSASKLTFPLLWSNSCCSHPLWTEAESLDVIEDVVRAAQKKLVQELGISVEISQNVPFHHYGRVKYHAFEGTEWGEHEGKIRVLRYLIYLFFIGYCVFVCS